MNDRLYHIIRPILSALRAWHRYEARGIEHVPRTGRALVVINHSLATYDALLLGQAIHEHTGRFTRGLADRLMFRLPLVRSVARELGIVEGSPTSGAELLAADELVMVSPGGMREALRPSSEEYEFDWTGRSGFARLAIKTRAPVVLAACPLADRIYDVYENPLTRAVYERFRFPLPLARGLGLTLIPRPAKLVHAIGAPIEPPRSTSEATVARFHAHLVTEMKTRMIEGLAERPHTPPPALARRPRRRRRA